MSYCGPRGIPLSVFLGWSQADQDAALGWQSHEARRCPGCGTHPDDWNEDLGGDRRAFHAEIRQCPGCVHVQRAKESPDVASGQQRGLQIRLAPGTTKGCARCSAE